MKMKNIYLLVLVLGVLVSACELPDNKDPKSATDVPATTVFSNALRDGLRHLDQMNQNVNVSRLMCQYSAMMQYPEPSRYIFDDRQIPDGYWNTTYLVLQDLKEVRMLIQDLTGSESFNRMNANRLAIVDIMEVLMYHNLVDILGDIPYSSALGGFDNKTPAYDDAATIYNDLLARLGSDIATLQAGINDGSWGAEDFVYGGDVEMWKKFAATLKLRLGMRLADTNPSAAQAELAAALSAGCLESGEAMQLPWVGVSPHVNTIYDVFVVANRNDYAPSLTIISLMEGLNDARMPLYFTQVDTSVLGEGKFAYVGLKYGLTSNESYPSYSHFGDVMFEPSFPATFACNAEVEFLLAEAAARGWTTPGTAAEHYEAGITESYAFWGADDTNLTAYLNQADVAYDAARWKELIGTQKWLALYNRGNEGWATQRIFDWPVMDPPEDMTQADIPSRLPYPYNEPDLNGENYTAAAAAIGGDDVRTLLFWDVEHNSATPSPN
jgi:hypothetical protein